MRSQLELYNRHSHQVYASAFRILRNTQEAEDIMQETFITAYKRLDDVEDEKKIGAWMSRIASNKSLNYIKRQRQNWVDLDEVEVVEEPEEDLNEYSIDHIYKCIEQLPEGFRIILTLFLIEGLSHKEIGDQIGIAESTSRSQYTRARRRLTEIITTQNG